MKTQPAYRSHARSRSDKEVELQIAIQREVQRSEKQFWIEWEKRQRASETHGSDQVAEEK